MPYDLSADPCDNYTVLDNAWRATNYTNSTYNCDKNLKWVGWYRLYLNGQNAQMSESCVVRSRCGTYIPLWLRGGHPKPEDGVVTRDVCGHEGYCCNFQSYPIRVKACTGGYYVYEFVTPTRCNMAYCADPCNNYTVLNDSRRSTNYYSSSSMCDRDVSWVGWYRLYLNGQSTRMPETCVAVNRCGTKTPLWLNDGHPKPEDGVVTRYVCDDLSTDPCYNYTVLDNAWRATNYSTNSSPSKCDRNVNWVGWYRLYLNGQNVRMPETCVEKQRCGTDVPLWLRGGHPKPEDGVVTRHVCGHYDNYCCYYESYPIKVKACTGGYYVYEFVKPATCNMAYCADVDSMNKTYISVMPAITTSDMNVFVHEFQFIKLFRSQEHYFHLYNCHTSSHHIWVTTATVLGDDSEETSSIQNLLDQIENFTVLNLTNVTMFMDKVFSTSEKINTSSDDPKKLASDVLKASEKLVSMLAKPTNTYDNVSFSHAAVEAQVFVVGPQANLDKIPQLNTSNASIDIDLIGIARNNLNSAAVAFMSYNTMEDLLKPDFFNTSDDTNKTMISTVISATLLTTTNKTLTKPVNFTLKHIREINNRGNLSCVYWNISEWIVDGCSVVKTNSKFTVCSCLHLSTFALIMQTNRSPSEDNSQPMESMNVVFVIVGLVFNSLALLTFAFCRWKPGVKNVARINLCISLLSAHLLFLLTQQFINLIKPHKELCAVISGALHFFFLSCFVWMFIEAVLLFICVKNISQISSRQRAMLNKGFLIVIGYAVDFVIVGVSAGLVPEGYGSEKCWIKVERGFIWSFLGPVCFILAINTVIFISIFISLNLTLKNLNLDVSHMRQTKITVFKTLTQFVIFGGPWILGFFVNNSKMIEILFLILNSQQGTFIFLVYCVLNNEVRQQYVKWIRAVFPGL
nr:adhesion G protein-coupled receptor E3-like [Misgurnus anguillicaudatus]